jgi:hypothetical protein
MYQLGWKWGKTHSWVWYCFSTTQSYRIGDTQDSKLVGENGKRIGEIVLVSCPHKKITLKTQKTQVGIQMFV